MVDVKKNTKPKTAPKKTNNSTLHGKPNEFPADMTDVLGEAFFDGEVVALDDIINQRIKITGFDRREGLYGPYYTIHIDEDQLVNCGGSEVMKRLDKIENMLPFEAYFVKKDLAGGKRMYTIVSPQTFMRMEASGEMQ